VGVCVCVCVREREREREREDAHLKAAQRDQASQPAGRNRMYSHIAVERHCDPIEGPNAWCALANLRRKVDGLHSRSASHKVA
jgi:hypothetical protein